MFYIEIVFISALKFLTNMNTIKNFVVRDIELTWIQLHIQKNSSVRHYALRKPMSLYIDCTGRYILLTMIGTWTHGGGGGINFI